MKNFVHPHEAECTLDSLNKLDDKWKDRYGGSLDSIMMCNRPEEARLSGKKDCAKSCHPGMDKVHCLSDKALPGYRSFSMIWIGDEVKRREGLTIRTIR